MHFKTQLEELHDKDSLSLKMKESKEKEFIFPAGYKAIHLTNEYDLDNESGYKDFPIRLNIENLKGLKTIDLVGIRTENLESKGLKKLAEVSITESLLQSADFSDCENVKKIDLTIETELQTLNIKGCKKLKKLFLYSCFNLDIDNIIIDESIQLETIEFGKMVHDNNRRFKTSEEAVNYLNAKAAILYNKEFEGAKDCWDSGLFNFNI